MENMRFKVGDRVRIKSLDWYNENKNNKGIIICGSESFTHPMSYFCNKVVSIITIQDNCYRILEDDGDWYWTDEMIEVLVEEETKFGTASNLIEPKSNANCLTLERVDALATKINKEFPSGNQNVWELSDDYQFVDENGNVINATKIVLEKKSDDKLKLESTKKVREYWNEYTRIFIEIYDDEPNECILTHLYTLEGHRQKGYGRQALIEAESIAKELGCHTAYLKVETNSWMHEWYLRMGYKWYKTVDKEYIWLVKNFTGMEKKKKEYPKTYEECCKVLDWNHRDYDRVGYKSELLCKLQVLLLCRDAYWQMAGEEMGLGKPWEQCDSKVCYGIITVAGEIQHDTIAKWRILTFPTAEMRDAFYEAFRKEIEICKELL